LINLVAGFYKSSADKTLKYELTSKS